MIYKHIGDIKSILLEIEKIISCLLCCNEGSCVWGKANKIVCRLRCNGCVCVSGSAFADTVVGPWGIVQIFGLRDSACNKTGARVMYTFSITQIYIQQPLKAIY